MPAEWKLSPVRRRSQPRTVGPEPQAARIDSRGDEPAVSTCGGPADLHSGTPMTAIGVVPGAYARSTCRAPASLGVTRDE
jgi:hypothetical protein